MSSTRDPISVEDFRGHGSCGTVEPEIADTQGETRHGRTHDGSAPGRRVPRAPSGWCSAAVAAPCSRPAIPDVGIGFLGVSLAFGLTVLTMAYAVGHISGGHFNPAVTVGLATARRFAWKDVPGYVVTQVVAAVVAAAVLCVVADGIDGFSAEESGFATNGYADRSPEGYSLLVGAGDRGRADRVLPLPDPRRHRHPRAQGLRARSRSASALTLIHLISIPVSNTSVNPARSTGPALFAGSDAIAAALGVLAGAPGRGRDRRGDLRHAARQRRGARPAHGGHRGLTGLTGAVRDITAAGSDSRRRRRILSVRQLCRRHPRRLPCRPPAVSPPSPRACSSPSA